ncbi:hypothetical protein F4678DRAFT_382429 [Xylaria arbuscula]|nr:hypothetical protein F4678DRAFT_382429 [Xylaria arbuscula]
MRGARLALTASNRRYASDELRFTGIDMGSGRSWNKYAYQHSDDDNDSTEADSQASSDSDTEDDARAEMENALVESALTRIRKAKAKGKQDVKLNKGELAALERRRKRLQAEAQSAARRKGKGSKRQKEKEQRVAVPLSQFDPSLPNRGSISISDDTLARPRSSTSSRHSLLQHHGSTSPFDYQYVSSASNRRHASDNGRSSSSLKNPQHDEDWNAQSQSHLAPDPFQYQTEGPAGSYPISALATPEDDTGSDGGPAHPRNSEDVNVVEAGTTPPLRRSKRKKSSSRNSVSSGGSRRRNDKNEVFIHSQISIIRYRFLRLSRKGPTQTLIK